MKSRSMILLNDRNWENKNLYKDPISSFYVKLLTDRQTDKQTDKRWIKHNLFGGGSNTLPYEWGYRPVQLIYANR